MGWQGNFNIRYEGENAQDFLDLTKMLIPNSLMRFDFSNCNPQGNIISLNCTRMLSWYTVEEDMKRLVSYLPDGDFVSVKINSGWEKETLTIYTNNGGVVLEKSNKKSDRYIDAHLGILEMLFSEHSPLYYHEPEEINICSIDGYVQLIANTFAGNERLIPAVCDFMYEVLDKGSINSFARDNEEKLSEEDCSRLDWLRMNFATAESTKEFLEQKKNPELSFESAKEVKTANLPKWLQVYPEEVISALGGASLLQKLIQTRGEELARKTIPILAEGIMKEMEEREI